MDRIYYAGDSVLTGTAIARALLEYAEALAKSATSATVDIPVRLPDGTLGRSKLLIGPASQVVADTEPEGGVDEEIVDDELVTYFQNETRKLQQNQQHRVAMEADVGDQSQNLGWIEDL